MPAIPQPVGLWGDYCLIQSGKKEVQGASRASVAANEVVAQGSEVQPPKEHQWLSKELYRGQGGEWNVYYGAWRYRVVNRVRTEDSSAIRKP